ncbi:MAG: helix-turn-helix domain-containing protein [Pirellulaceae bacterium]
MKVYTTGEVSKLCNVSTATVNKWFDTGQLPGYRVPGSKHRRIPHDNLVRFLKKHNAPLGALADAAAAEVLVVSQDRQLIGQLRDVLDGIDSLHVMLASDGFGVGMQLESSHPQCVVVDFGIGEAVAMQLCGTLRQRLDPGTQIIAIAGHQTLVGQWAADVDEVFRRPFDPSLLVQRIRSIAGEAAEEDQSGLV